MSDLIDELIDDPPTLGRTILRTLWRARQAGAQAAQLGLKELRERYGDKSDD